MKQEYEQYKVEVELEKADYIDAKINELIEVLNQTKKDME